MGGDMPKYFPAAMCAQWQLESVEPERVKKRLFTLVSII